VATTVAEIIDAARDRHPAFTERMIGDKAAMRFLSQYQRRLVNKILNWNADYIATKQNVSYLATYLWNSTGYTLPANVQVIGGTVNLTDVTDDNDPLTIVKYSDRLNPMGRFPAYIKDGILYLCGYSQDWTTVESIDLEYVAIPDLFTALDDEISLPDNASDLLVAKLVLFMASIVVARKAAKIDKNEFVSELTEAQDDFFLAVAGQRQAGAHYVREEW